MAIHSSFLGSMIISGDEAKSFSQKLSYARGTKAASAAASSGKKLVASFVKSGVVTVELPRPKTASNAKKKTAA